MVELRKDSHGFQPGMLCTFLAMLLDLRIVLVSNLLDVKSKVFTPSGYYSECYIDLRLIAKTKLAWDKRTVYLLESGTNDNYDLILFNGQIGEFINNNVLHKQIMNDGLDTLLEGQLEMDFTSIANRSKDEIRNEIMTDERKRELKREKTKK